MIRFVESKSQLIELASRVREDFILDVKETTSTLLNFDIVDLEKTAPGKFLDAIKKEGIVLYEKI